MSKHRLYDEEVDSITDISDPLRRLPHYLISVIRQGKVQNVGGLESKEYGKVPRAAK
ncbi:MULTISPECIES: hypothetical protein [Prevotellaceae]|uniref:hypothetical protein n=1 Tax=Prevotellaceae TaxID=171552 RepID=UPI000400C08C|nr:hypothetical protein [Prevotella phocaeensis]